MTQPTSDHRYQVRWVLAVHVPLDDGDTTDRENAAFDLSYEAKVDLESSLREELGGDWKVTLDA